MPKETLNEREFELVNIIGAELGANQRDLSRHMNLSLGMINVLMRRLISKGYIRIEQLNKKKVQYLLTPRGFSEKMRKSVKYTMKTISSIGLIKDRVREVLSELCRNGEKDFFYLGNTDVRVLAEMVLREILAEDFTLTIINEIPQEQIDGVLLTCKEGLEEEDLAIHTHVDLVKELAKDHSLALQNGDSGISKN